MATFSVSINADEEREIGLLALESMLDNPTRVI